MTPLRLLGYCTNVHPGTDAASILNNLAVYAGSIREKTGGRTLGVGLWLPARAVAEFKQSGTKTLIETMKRNQLVPYTINGFPYDNFHQPRVKHAVYRPTWWQNERLTYTRDLAEILAAILPRDATLGTISTLPIGWPAFSDRETQLEHAGTNLRRIAEDLRRLEERTGKRIVVAIEPEPGCVLQTCEDVVQWFQQQLPDALHRRYLGVCHDVCHSAVMMEDQSETIQRYAAAGIVLAKLQVSSAITIDWSTLDASRKASALSQLESFAEDRYLHQTMRLTESGTTELVDDLPECLALARKTTSFTDRRWTIHFHVPIFRDRLDHLQTTRDDIGKAMAAIDHFRQRPIDEHPLHFTGHLEIETYAWSVMPAASRGAHLVDDVASEINWFRETLGTPSV